MLTDNDLGKLAFVIALAVSVALRPVPLAPLFAMAAVCLAAWAIFWAIGKLFDGVEQVTKQTTNRLDPRPHRLLIAWRVVLVIGVITGIVYAVLTQR